jgi:CHASE2 domain-containing sensor protein
MGFLIVLNFGNGTVQTGCETVIAQLWDADRPQPMQVLGRLPGATGLVALYQHWRSNYEALYSHLSWRGGLGSDFEIDETDVTHISLSDFEDVCGMLQRQLNAWLKVDSFQPIDRQLRTYLNPIDEIRLIIVAEDASLLQLPWHLWQFLEDYPNAEIAISPPHYTRSIATSTIHKHQKIKILAILGNSQGIDIVNDRQLLERLPNAEICFLIEPTSQVLTEHLWKPGWDLLFFAGHSSSQGKGVIHINPIETLTIDQLKYGLRHAIQQGLKLAIFNSCDGLGLARDLSDLHLPQMIVMRESIPDRVAQLFLKQFLAAFSSGQSLYRSVRQAREQLQAIEREFPCATWLPVICQNPAEVPPYWADWLDCAVVNPAEIAPSSNVTKSWKAATALSSLLSLAFMVIIRSMGGLQSLELAMYDQFLRSRPIEPPDPRLLLVTVTDQDIQAQGSEPRRGSLSDRTLTQLLKTLNAANPRAIGLDIYRDFPTTTPALVQQLQQNDRLISICKRPDPTDNPTGILPPPEMPESQIGFSDFVQDRDGTMRRHLLSMTPNPTSHCTAAYAFSTQLALRYFADDGITASFTPKAELQLRQTRFQRLRDRFSGYQSIDTRGLQMLLNYRQTPSPKDVAAQITLTELLQGQVNPKAIANRIVLIGVASPTSGDNWATPYGQQFSSKVPGVIIQAHMTSQILSAVLDRRPLISAWSLWQEYLWILSWAILGGFLGMTIRRWIWLLTAILIALIILFSLIWALFLQGVWIPIVPPILTLLLTSITAPKLAPKLTPKLAPKLQSGQPTGEIS